MSTFSTFDQLVGRVQQRAGSTATKQEIEQLLTLEEPDSYEKDDPRSTGKYLRILSIQFSGVKNTGELIDYQRSPASGLNLWVGDNLVGKSSIFKVVKLAITGKNSIDRGIAKWLQDIWVEFTFGSDIFTVHIYKKGAFFIHNFYALDKEQLASAGEEEKKAARLYHGSLEGYKDFLDEFFFQQFEYYAMQWVSKTGVRSDPRSYARDISWATCFSSVYLAAEEYNKLLYGQQAGLVFQMLLGLELTLPINRLTTKRGLLEADLGLLNATSIPQGNPGEAEVLRAQLGTINQEIRTLRDTMNAVYAPVQTAAAKALEAVQGKYQAAVSLSGQLSTEVATLTAQLAAFQTAEIEHTKRLRGYDADINRKSKKAKDLRDYVQFGAFFNSLEVKVCPSCSHDVKPIMVKQEKETGNCRLCHEHRDDHQVAEEGAYDDQIAELNQQVDKLKADRYDEVVRFAEIKHQWAKADALLTQKRTSFNAISLEQLAGEVDRAQKASQVKPIIIDVDKSMSRIAELAVQKSNLDTQLKAFAQPNAILTAQKQAMEKSIRLLTTALQELEQMREERSAALLAQLNELYLEQLHAFGLTDYEAVEIDEKFKVSFVKLGEECDFEEISAGEQLRTKLGLYIALIQLDVQHGYGRHPRFLILDSPAKEEADASFVEGLRLMLTYIEDNMADELQVFVGTTVRTLATAVDAEKLEEHGYPDALGNKDYFF